MQWREQVAPGDPWVTRLYVVFLAPSKKYLPSRPGNPGHPDLLCIFLTAHSLCNYTEYRFVVISLEKGVCIWYAKPVRFSLRMF